MSNIVNERPFVRAPPPLDAAAPVIMDVPTLDELTFVERADRTRPYVAAVLVAIAACLLVACLARLARRAYMENVPSSAAQPADRRSLRKAAKST